MTRHIKYILTVCLLAGGVFASKAQLNSSVEVEGTYQPLVIDTDPLATFPKSFKFELPTTNLEYDYSSIVTEFKPDILSMGVSGQGIDWPWKKRRGFVDFNMGSYLNTNLHAGCYLLNDSVNTLLADLKFHSSTLYREHRVPDTYTKPPRKRLYDGQIGLHYSRLIGSEGLFNAAVGYRAGYFNYYGTTIDRELLDPEEGGIHIPTQTVNNVNAKVGFSSSPSIIKGWHLEGGVNYLAYRRLYSPVTERLATSGDRETHLDLGGGYAFNFASYSAIAVDAKGDFLFYSDRQPLALATTDYKRHNYGIINLKPAYRFAKDELTIKAGVNITASYDAMGKEPGKHFGALHFSPDAVIEYKIPAGVGILLAATGGVTPSTLQLKETFNRYQMPWLLSTQPVYTPIDARLAINVGPFSGFTGSIGIRYAAAKNVPLGGWYQDYLGAYVKNPLLNQNMDFYLDPYTQSVNLHGFSFDLDLKYAYGTRVELAFNGNYTPQRGKLGIFNGFDRPRWIMSASAAVRPIDRLKVELGYEYRGVRNCYLWTQGLVRRQLEAYRLPDVCRLNARVTYSLLDNLDIYIKGENLLNQYTQLLPGLQSEGIVIAGGFYLEF